MAATFNRVIKMQGFDADRTPPWQMVPVGGHRYTALRGGAGMTVTSANLTLATVAEVPLATVPMAERAPLQSGDRIFKITGVARGSTQIQAKTGAVIAAALDIGTKNRKTVNIAFNFVSDNAGHRTRRNTSQVDAWLRGINWIYNGQTNIEFRKKSAQPVAVPQNLGRVVRFSSHLPGVPAVQHEWSVVTALGDATADLNMFFVWEYEQDLTPFVDDAEAGTSGGNCLFEDTTSENTVEVLSHEIGHYLGCNDHYVAARSRELMYGSSPSGIHIPKQDVDIMNP